jgi:hypothetical protein
LIIAGKERKMAKFNYEFEIDDEYSLIGDFSRVCDKCPFNYDDVCLIADKYYQKVKAEECQLNAMKVKDK